VPLYTSRVGIAITLCVCVSYPQDISLNGITRCNFVYKQSRHCNGAIQKRPIAKTAPKISISKKIVQNGPLRCPKWPIVQPKRPIAKSKMTHSYIQNSPLSLSAFGNVRSGVGLRGLGLRLTCGGVGLRGLRLWLSCDIDRNHDHVHEWLADCECDYAEAASDYADLLRLLSGCSTLCDDKELHRL